MEFPFKTEEEKQKTAPSLLTLLTGPQCRLCSGQSKGAKWGTPSAPPVSAGTRQRRHVSHKGGMSYRALLSRGRPLRPSSMEKGPQYSSKNEQEKDLKTSPS